LGFGTFVQASHFHFHFHFIDDKISTIVADNALMNDVMITKLAAR